MIHSTDGNTVENHSISAEDRLAINLEALESLEQDGVISPLTRGVDTKVRAGQQLTEVEAGVLWLGITQEGVDFVKKHGL
jgi:hypothetical protein